MVLKKIYDEQTKTQKVWYDSTMFVFTKAVEHASENYVDLYVTFKTGVEYKYKDVKLEDYILLLSGYEQSSHGKTLNKIIKPNYEVEKVGNVSIEKIWEEYNLELEKDKAKQEDKNNTIFISGHRDITEEEFEIYYQPRILTEIEENPDVKFVIGDYHGCDIIAQNFLIDIEFNPDNITVYHMKESARNINPKIKNTVGGFETDEERDAAMTNNSYKDIAFVRDHTKLSGTAQNILRRFEFS